jgi:hypothetical protein
MTFLLLSAVALASASPAAAQSAPQAQTHSGHGPDGNHGPDGLLPKRSGGSAFVLPEARRERTEAAEVSA